MSGSSSEERPWINVETGYGRRSVPTWEKFHEELEKRLELEERLVSLEERLASKSSHQDWCRLKDIGGPCDCKN